jgi:class 3 adenylate cyclase
MALSIYLIDVDPGIHCIMILIIFNYIPVRYGEKAPICAFALAVWSICFIYSTFYWDSDEMKKDLWNYPKNSGTLHDLGFGPLLYNVINPIGTTFTFLIISVWTVIAKEKGMAVNLLAIKIGECQTAFIVKSTKTNQMLLESMRPPEITDKLDKRTNMYVESYSDVTVLFCMIVDFQDISDVLNAEELVKLLNIIYSEFDQLADTVDMYKVETVGEVYMMSGGCPRREVKHAENAATMALRMIQGMPKIREHLKKEIIDDNLSVEHKERKTKLIADVAIKVGLNTGQLTAGIIGATCQRFKLFGDTVNTASRMESRSLPGKVQVSESTFKLLIKANFLFTKREPIEFKGKGVMQTYFLVGSLEDEGTVEYDKTLLSKEDIVRNNLTAACQEAMTGMLPEINMLWQSLSDSDYQAAQSRGGGVGGRNRCCITLSLRLRLERRLMRWGSMSTRRFCTTS